MKRKHFTSALALGGVLLLAEFGAAQVNRLQPGIEPPGRHAAGQLIKVITYNVQFLPGLASLANDRKEPGYRAKTIGQKMVAFDVVGLNEVFHNVHRKLLLAELQHAWGKDYHVVVSPEPPGPRFNGGLAIVSRLDFLETHSMTYSKWSTPKDYGFQADGFAAKGALHARIRRGKEAPANDFIDVFVTHLESKDSSVREVQYSEYSAFIAKHSDPGRPALIMGDFNTKGNPPAQRDRDSKYHRLLSKLQEARPTVVDLWPALRGQANGGTQKQETTERGGRIDYIFLSNPNGSKGGLKPLDIRVNGFLDPRVVALSDHSAVEADFRWDPVK